MARGVRSTKSPRRGLPSRRAILSRKYYFPVRTGRKRGIPILSPSGKPTVPEDWTGTDVEWAIFQAALQIGLKEHADFEYKAQVQVPLGGLDNQVDFLFHGTLVVEAQGFFWHNVLEFAVRNDAERKSRILAAGYDYVAIDGENLVGPRADPVFYLRAALEGRDYSVSAR
jgi:very-short-patch-repair endonuclease